MLQDAPAKLCNSLVSICPRTMQVPFVLRFCYPDETDKIDRLIRVSS